MPFTPTHMLAVVPIAAVSRGWLPFSALAIGSMIPDFPLFCPISPSYATTHSPLGLFTACLPLGLAAFFLFHSVMKAPLLALLPRAIQSRCLGLEAPTRRTLVPAVLALVAGAATHVFWDSFTHRGRWGTQLVPALNAVAFQVGGQPIAGYKLFQYGSTFVGLPCLFLLLMAWLKRREPREIDPNHRLSMKTKGLAYALAVVLPACVSLLVWQQRDLSRYERLGQAISDSGLALAIASLGYCLVFQMNAD
ncbi:MAG: DUF4184 family protein [Isosphaeraceae bacterium]